MNATQTPAATGTLANPDVRLYLRMAASAQASADKLQAMYMHMEAHKDGADACDAIWDGYWSLQQDAIRQTMNLRGAGGLLFVGSAQALATATLIEAQA